MLEDYLAHHKRVQTLYCELLKDVDGLKMHKNPSTLFDSNFWLCTATLDPNLKIRGEEDVYKSVIKGAVGGATGVVHAATSARTTCQPNDNVEALRVFLDKANIEARPLWKPMHRQPVFADCPAYVNGVSEQLFEQGICLPAGPYVTDDHVHYIVANIKKALAE